jgi:hypothetical protein
MKPGYDLPLNLMPLDLRAVYVKFIILTGGLLKLVPPGPLEIDMETLLATHALPYVVPKIFL